MMTVGFFTVFRKDPQHYLHASSLVSDVHIQMPGVRVVQFTDETSPPVPGVSGVKRLPGGPMLERRLEHYASCRGQWVLLDTDVSVRSDVRAVFDDPFDVALADRHWPGVPQGDEMLLTMPYNTGVIFTRSPQFWRETLETWRAMPETDRDWLSEQRAVYQVIRSGRYRVKILDGRIYNYPPKDSADPCASAALVHYKGRRKAWLTERYYQTLRETA